MTIRVETDGLIIHLDYGVQVVRGQEVPVVGSEVCYAGAEFEDDQVMGYIVEMAKGDDPRLSYVDDEDASEPEPELIESEAEVEDETSGDLFDPRDHNQDEVMAYLAEASEEEVGRVKAAEAEGKRRPKVIAYTSASKE